MNKKLEFFVPDHRGHCGDNICCISAAIEFAEVMDAVVYLGFFKDVVEAYKHPLLKYSYEPKGITMNVCAADKHRNKHPGLFCNILGTYYAEFGLPINDPVLRLPKFDPVEPRALIQPVSKFVKNPSTQYLQMIVDYFVSTTGLKLFVIGSENTPKILKNVDYSLLKDSVPHLMNQVQNAICVLTPRSLSANLAAGYERPSFMWSPDDGEDWHLNYRNRIGMNCNLNKDSESTIDMLRDFIVKYNLVK